MKHTMTLLVSKEIPEMLAFVQTFLQKKTIKRICPLCPFAPANWDEDQFLARLCMARWDIDEHNVLQTMFYTPHMRSNFPLKPHILVQTFALGFQFLCAYVFVFFSRVFSCASVLFVCNSLPIRVAPGFRGVFFALGCYNFCAWVPLCWRDH